MQVEQGGISTIAARSPAAQPPGSKYDRLITRAQSVPAATTIVVHPCDETSLRGAVEAAEAGIIVPVLVGPAGKITAVAREHGSTSSPSTSSTCHTATMPPPKASN